MRCVARHDRADVHGRRMKDNAHVHDPPDDREQDKRDDVYGGGGWWQGQCCALEASSVRARACRTARRTTAHAHTRARACGGAQNPVHAQMTEMEMHSAHSGVLIAEMKKSRVHECSASCRQFAYSTRDCPACLRSVCACVRVGCARGICICVCVCVRVISWRMCRAWLSAHVG